MKTAFKVTISLVVVAALGLITVLALGLAGVLPGFGMGFGGAPLALVNRQVFAADELDRVSLTYSSEDITILPAAGNEVVLEEYMNRDDEDAKASISNSGGHLDIRQGNRGWSFSWFGGWHGEIKLYIPQTFDVQLTVAVSSAEVAADHDFELGGLTIETSSGDIDLQGIQCEDDIALSSTSGSIEAEQLDTPGEVRLSSSSGDINPGRVHAAQIRGNATSGGIRFASAVGETVSAHTSSGDIRFDYLEGAFALEASSGEVVIEQGGGQGTVGTSSGGINITLDTLTGDLSITSSSGGSRLAVPQNASLSFTARTSSGDIRVPDGAVGGYNRDGNEANYTLGDNPVHTVSMQASSGDVELRWV